MQRGEEERNQKKMQQKNRMTTRQSARERKESLLYHRDFRDQRPTLNDEVRERKERKRKEVRRMN